MGCGPPNKDESSGPHFSRVLCARGGDFRQSEIEEDLLFFLKRSIFQSRSCLELKCFRFPNAVKWRDLLLYADRLTLDHPT